MASSPFFIFCAAAISVLFSGTATANSCPDFRSEKSLFFKKKYMNWIYFDLGLSSPLPTLWAVCAPACGAGGECPINTWPATGRSQTWRREREEDYCYSKICLGEMKLFQQEPPQADPRWLPGGQDELQSARLRAGGLHRQGEGVRARQGDEDSTPAPTFLHIILLNSFYVSKHIFAFPLSSPRPVPDEQVLPQAQRPWPRRGLPLRMGIAQVLVRGEEIDFRNKKQLPTFFFA